MTFELGSLTVLFSEEDKDLWEVIQSFPKDQQASVIKKVLVRYLKEDPEYQVPKSNSDGLENPAQYPVQSEWKLDALFVTSEMETMANQREMDCCDENERLQPGMTSNPLQHLFEIIGEEEDEDVIKFLRETDILPSSIQNHEVSSEENLGISTENKDKSYSVSIDSYGRNRVEPIQQGANTVKSNGLNFILQHVIGEEEDEEVLQFFGNSRNDESNDYSGSAPD